MNRPKLVVVIGANGAGKTTWAQRHRKRLPLNFYNADSIAEGLGDANSPEQQARARALVDQEIAERLRLDESFGFESTWSGASRPAIVRDASARGYETHAVFLGTAHPEINIARVRRRVASYHDADRALRALLRDFGPHRAKIHTEHPFWRLRNDGVWEVEREENVTVTSSGDAHRKSLLEHDIHAGFSEPVHAAFKADENLARQIAHALVDRGRSWRNSTCLRWETVPNARAVQ